MKISLKEILKDLNKWIVHVLEDLMLLNWQI